MCHSENRQVARYGRFRSVAAPSAYTGRVVSVDAREHLRSVAARPGVYVSYGAAESWPALVAYVDGFDHGTYGGLLTGFSEFLIVKFDSEFTNLAWSGYVWNEADRRGTAPDQRESSAIALLFESLDAFLAISADPRARREMFVAYAEHRGRF